MVAVVRGSPIISWAYKAGVGVLQCLNNRIFYLCANHYLEDIANGVQVNGKVDVRFKC